MVKDKEHYRKLVADIAKDNPKLDWKNKLEFIKESIRDDIKSDKGE